MCLPSLSALLVLMLASVSCARAPGGAESAQRVLRVCSDPNNLPFSNNKGEGFENKIAELVAADWNAKLEYTWFAQRRGFVRNTLRAGECDVIVGVPKSFELTATTRPYYRSSYVFVSREDRNINVTSMDDPVLKELEIGVHVIGDDYANAPPMHALARRNMIRNVSGYSIFGDYSQPNPPARLVEAVASRDIDVAIVWGPLAGYFSKLQSAPLKISAVSPDVDLPSLPFVFDIAMGVRRGEETLRQELESVLDRREKEIDSILAAYGVPVQPLSRDLAGTTGR